MSVPSQTLFDRVLAYCELSPMTGPGILQRALADEGADAATATPADYRRALPHIESRLRAYYDEEESARRARRIVGFLAFADGDLADDDDHAFSTIGRTYQQHKADEARRAAARPTSGTARRAEVAEQIAEAERKAPKRG